MENMEEQEQLMQKYLVLLHGLNPEGTIADMYEMLPDRVRIIDREDQRLIVLTPIWCEEAVVAYFEAVDHVVSKCRVYKLAELMEE